MFKLGNRKLKLSFMRSSAGTSLFRGLGTKNQSRWAKYDSKRGMLNATTNKVKSGNLI
jgi:hypothetical protein